MEWFRQTYRGWLLLVLLSIIVLGVIVYRPILDFTFFWEDPFDVGQVEGHSTLDLFLVPTNNLYYRPLFLTLVKFLKLGQPDFSPYPFFLFNLIARIVGSLLLFGFARRLLNNASAALGAALIFLLTPIPYDSTAKAMSAHQVLVLPFLSALWLYLEGRQKKQPPLIGLSIILVIISLLVHESAVLLPIFILSLELYLYRQQRVFTFSRAALVFLVPVGLFAFLWLTIPKDGTLLSFDHGLDKALYLSQSLSFPFARLISRLGGLGLEPSAQAVLALLVTLVILFVLFWRAFWTELLLFMFWWFLASALIWLTLSYDYLWTGSRLLYLPSLAAALAWGGTLLNRKGWRFFISRLLVLLILLQSLLNLISLNSLYGSGSQLMEEVIKAGQRYEQILFINVPDRFENRQSLYPLGFWGMMLAPVSQQLADFVALTSNAEIETLSLSNFPLADDMRTLSPYRVNSRGSDAYGTTLLYDSILWAKQTYYVSYGSQGELVMAPVGNIEALSDQELEIRPIASFDQSVGLVSANTDVGDGELTIETTYIVDSSPAEGVTLFIHLVDVSGQIVAQADGDSLGGMIPPRAWREGNRVTDIRSISYPPSVNSSSLRLLIGFYSRWDGIRLPVEGGEGQEIENDAVVLPIS